MLKHLEQLFLLADPEYKAFHSCLMPTIEMHKIIGIRVPLLKKYAKEMEGKSDFLASLPHDFYEENNLHAFLLNDLKDFDDCVQQVCNFLPYVDNWATCDGLRPKAFAKDPQRLLPFIYEWLRSDHCYTVRFGIEMLMCYFLDEHFDPEYFQVVGSISSCEYYVNMMIAWYFATALAKQNEAAMAFLKEGHLSPWCFRKTVQKALESRRLTNAQKEETKKLKTQ